MSLRCFCFTKIATISLIKKQDAMVCGWLERSAVIKSYEQKMMRSTYDVLDLKAYSAHI